MLLPVFVRLIARSGGVTTVGDAGTTVTTVVGVIPGVTTIVAVDVVLTGFGLFGSLTVEESERFGPALAPSVPLMLNGGRHVPGATGYAPV